MVFFQPCCYYFLLHKCTLISLCALLPDCAKLYIYTQIYIYIWERDIFIQYYWCFFLFYCWIKLLSELHLPLVINYCNGLGQWSYSQSKFVFPVSLFCHLSQFLIKKKKKVHRFHLNKGFQVFWMSTIKSLAL